jgi:peptide/nickel transport system permease protein
MERWEQASQSQLIWHNFTKHRLAVVSLVLLFLMFMVAIFAEFVAPYQLTQRFRDYANSPPTKVHFFDENGKLSKPFIYGTKTTLNPATFTYVYEVDTSIRYPLKMFVKTNPYKIAGIIPANRKLFGVDGDQPLFLMGSDLLGRDLFTRIIIGSRISLFVGLGGVLISFTLGLVLGGISGYFGGKIDEIIQRGIDFIMSLPQIPLWMALSAAVPKHWSGIQTYFAITIILSLVGWTGLARVVRGKLIALREEDFVVAAKVSNASDAFIITRHLIPGFMSYLIVNLTMAIPGMILGETTLSFLGLGILPPNVSLGSLLQDAQNLTAISNYPWLLFPGLFVVAIVILFNFVGDGLRDAADPYGR